MRARTVICPFRADAHPDHCATFHIAREAVTELNGVRLLEYPVMLGPNAIQVLMHRAFVMWQIDVSSAYQRKLTAIDAHRSQLGALVHDDPTGTVLSEELLQSFKNPFELLFALPG